jgi:hypothetical protein
MVLRKALTLSCALVLVAGTRTVLPQADRRPAQRAVTGGPRAPEPNPQTVGGSAATPAIEYGVRIDPDTVVIGQPFRVVVRVRAPQSAHVAFPAGPDSGSAVEALDPRTVETRPDSLAADVTAIYRLAAWDLGRLPLALGGVLVQDHGLTRTIPLGAASVVVTPTVPARGAARTARPARPFFPDLAPWWWRWAIGGALLVAVAIAWLVTRWWRRRSRRTLAPREAVSVAHQELTELDRLGLLEAGEWGRYLALVAEVVRSYLARRIPEAPLSYTTSELLAAIQRDARVPIDRLRALLTETDFVKFAGQSASTERARAAASAARTLVTDIDAAIVAADAAARDAAARQVAREFEERRAARATGSRGRAA